MALLKEAVVRGGGGATRGNPTTSKREQVVNGKWRQQRLKVAMDNGI
jgi:hypothetical protein